MLNGIITPLNIICGHKTMTNSQRLTIKSSELRSRLNELSSLDELADEALSELEDLSNQYKATESQLRAALLSEGETERRALASAPDREQRERSTLIERANVGMIFDAALEQRQTDGAERELQTEYGLQANQIPLAMLEQRAAATASAPAKVGQNQAEIVPVVFPMSAAAFLGVEMPTVAVGEAVYPVMTAPTSHASSVAEDAEVMDTTATFSADVLSPRRIQRSFTYSREDAAKFSGMDAALRTNLQDGLSDGLDYAVLRTTNEGLLDFGTDPTVAATTTFAGYKSAIYDSVDGRYAGMASDVRLLVGAKTYQHMAVTYRANNADDSALDVVMRISGGVRVSAHVPAPSSNDQFAATARAIGLRHAVAPIWEGVTILSDPYSESKFGQIRLTAIMLYAFKIIRTAGFNRLAFQLA